LGINGWW